MNALMVSSDTSEAYDMSSSDGANERQQTGELRSDVRHLQSDVTEIKAEVRVVHHRIDALRSELTGRIEKLDAKAETLRTELTGKIDALKDSLASAKVWALVLYIGLAAAMLLTMAHGFKWL